MENETNVTNVTNESDQDYIEAIKELKENTVPKEQFEKVQEEKKKLLNALLNDNRVDSQSEPKESVENLQNDLRTLKKELAVAQEQGMSNLEYVSKALKFRQKAIALGLQDPFLPNSPMGPDDNDIKTAQKVADKLQECVDEANGNPAVFRNLFEQAVRDDSKLPNLNKQKRR